MRRRHSLISLIRSGFAALFACLLSLQTALAFAPVAEAPELRPGEFWIQICDGIGPRVVIFDPETGIIREAEAGQGDTAPSCPFCVLGKLPLHMGAGDVPLPVQLARSGAGFTGVSALRPGLRTTRAHGIRAPPFPL